MTAKIELLAPGGDIDSIKAAIVAGADAIYCGLDKFNARNRAENILLDDLNGILRLAHQHNCEIFLTLNIIIIDSEIPALVKLLNRLVNTTIDGVIVQDLGMLYLLAHYFPALKVHASTQLTTHNEGQIRFLNQLGATRVNLSRELNLEEIGHLAAIGHQHQMLSEVFVHGSNCIGFSGLCYLSSAHGGNSGNRGRCSQSCRDPYQTTAMGKEYPLNLKDNSAYSDLQALADAGVDSVKIEGRIKKFHYVYTVVDAWRIQLNRLYAQQELLEENHELYKVFNRDFSNAFLSGHIDREMFIDNPRDHSALHLVDTLGVLSDASLNKAKKELYQTKTEIINEVRNKIDLLSASRVPLVITVHGEAESPLRLIFTTPDTTFEAISDLNLVQLQPDREKIDPSSAKPARNGQALDEDLLLRVLKSINETEYSIGPLNTHNLAKGLFIPFKEINSLKRKILKILNGSRDFVDPIRPLDLGKRCRDVKTPRLSVLISSTEELHLCEKTSAEYYFQLPSHIRKRFTKLVTIFSNHPDLIPWFPAVLIGDDYHAAENLLTHLRPRRIVTNNSGIAFAAYKQGISWSAGPFMNVVNSLSLLCLKEEFNCAGAFISNEIKREQIVPLRTPVDFELSYSIYHPIELMTSRQCLFHQVTGCNKNRVDHTCIDRCQRSASMINMKQSELFIDKSKGDYHKLYHETHYLNTDVVTDFQGLFTNFMIDLRDVKTTTTVSVHKTQLIESFLALIRGDQGAVKFLKESIQPSSWSQYKKGI